MQLVTARRYARAFPVLLLLAFLNFSAYAIFFQSYYVDKLCQWASLAGWESGHGFSLSWVGPDHLETVNWTVVNGWPPGYQFLMMPLVRSGMTYIWADFALYGLGGGLFLASWGYIVSRTELLSPAGKLAVLSYWACLCSPVSVGLRTLASSEASCALLLTSTDLLSLGFFSLGLASSYSYLLEARAWLLVASVTMTGIAAAIRFSYCPLLLVIPLSFHKLALKRRALSPCVAVASALGVTFVAMIYAVQVGMGAEATTYVSETLTLRTRELHLSNLVSAYPFFPIIGSGALEACTRLASLCGFPESVRLACQVLLCLVFVIAFYKAYRFAFEGHCLQSHREADRFLAISGMLIALITLAMLGGLSILLPADRVTNWTYVLDARYYAPLMPHFSIAIFVVAFAAWERAQVFQTISRAVVGFLVIFYSLWKVSAALLIVQSAWLPSMETATRFATLAAQAKSLQPRAVAGQSSWTVWLALDGTPLVIDGFKNGIPELTSPQRLQAGGQSRLLYLKCADDETGPPAGEAREISPAGRFQLLFFGE